MQNRKFRLICSTVVSTCSTRLNLENEYPHFMFLTINNEVIWSLKSPNHASCPPLLLNVSGHERTNRTRISVAHHVTDLIFYNITRCYGKHVAVLAVAVATGDIIKYQSFVYGSFVWGIHVRHNNVIYIYCKTLMFSHQNVITK